MHTLSFIPCFSRRMVLSLLVSLLCLTVLDIHPVAAQDDQLEPTETEALLILMATDLEDQPRPREILQVIGEQSGKKYKVVTDEQGEARLLLPKGDSYRIRFRMLNEWKDTQAFRLPAEEGRFTQKFTLRFDYEADRVTLDNVFFDTGKASLRPESFEELNGLAEVMEVRPALRIAIEGHTDNVGDDASNMKLSKQRAESVKQYLVSKGIAADRIEAKGFGETRPVASNDTAEGRQQNRRTEVVVLGGYED